MSISTQGPYRTTESEDNQITVAVYLDDGRVYEYTVKDQLKAREHAAAIVANGYRQSNSPTELEHYPPHRILKVKLTGNGITTNYTDTGRGT